MNKKLKLVLLGALVIGAIGFTTGCTHSTLQTVVTNPVTGILETNTTTVTTVDTNTILSVESAVLQVGVKEGSIALFAKYPASRQIAIDVNFALTAALNSGQFDSATLANILAPIATTSDGQSLADDLLTLYAASEGKVVTAYVTKNVFVAAGLTAVSKGLTSAIAITATAKGPCDPGSSLEVE